MPDTPALLTGSRAYGTPREDSDVDLVIRVRDAATLAAIREAADPVMPNQGHSARAGRSSFRFGDLNLIVCHTDAEYAVWAAGTAELVDRAPVAREEAVAVFKRLRGGGA